MDSGKSATEPQNGSEPLRALIEAPSGEPIALLHACGAAPARLYRDPLEVLTVAADRWM